MGPIEWIRAAIVDVLKCRRGSAAAYFAIAAIPTIAAVGLALDTARGYMIKAKLSQALDAAALAGGRVQVDDDDVRIAEIQAFFDANFPEGYMGADVDDLDIDLSQLNVGLIGVSTEVQLPVSLMAVLGLGNFNVASNAVVQRETRGMELVLVMDNTGSMRSSGKIGAMKDAAQALVDMMYEGQEEIDNFWVALVPYAATVNIGPQHDDWVAGLNPADYQPTEWKGCVEARPEPYDSTDDLPEVQMWTPHFWESTMGMYPETGDNDWDGANIDETNNAQNNGVGPNLGCGPKITPLVPDYTTVTAAVAEMAPWHRGGTMANLGLAWGWRVLSPDWRGRWGDPSPDMLPLDYDEPLMDKVIVLMTDGVNEWYDWPGGLPGSPDSGTYPDADYTAYGRLSEGRLGTTNNGAAKAEINQRMLGLCTAMKAEDIIMFTITFRVNDQATKDLYRDCATDDDHYYNSPSNSDLHGAFVAIGQELTNLRLVGPD